MKYFQALVSGEHFLMDWGGGVRYMGFFVTRYVSEETEAEAVRSAIAAVRSEDKLEGLVLNTAEDPPKLLVDELEEVSEDDVPSTLPGYVFYREEEVIRSHGRDPDR